MTRVSEVVAAFNAGGWIVTTFDSADAARDGAGAGAMYGGRGWSSRRDDSTLNIWQNRTARAEVWTSQEDPKYPRSSRRIFLAYDESGAIIRAELIPEGGHWGRHRVTYTNGELVEQAARHSPAGWAERDRQEAERAARSAAELAEWERQMAEDQARRDRADQLLDDARAMLADLGFDPEPATRVGHDQVQLPIEDLLSVLRLAMRVLNRDEQQ